MKLISCYIENFGNISCRSFEFGAGLTSFCEHNGYGKTTLAAFLKAMFYGLKATTARDKELGERAHYYPFGGGKFGGNVTFERDGAIYKIERFFGKKSATEDTVRMYKGGSPAPVPEDIGKEFFGMDEQSFMRTVFVTSADTQTGATADIGRMLNGFVDDADYEGAVKLLKEQRKIYKADRGSGGKISEKHDEILQLKSRIENKRTISAGLGAKYAERAALDGEIKELEKKRSAVADANVTEQKWRNYDGMAADAAAARARLNALTAAYPAGIPDVNEARTLKENAETLALARERLSSLEFSAQKKQRLDELAERFNSGAPTDTDMQAANSAAAEAIRLGAEAENYARLSKGGGINFPAGVPDESEVEKYGEKVRSLRGVGAKPTGKKTPAVLAVAAVILLCAGIGLLFVSAAAGGVCLALGAVVAAAAGFVYFKGQINGLKGAHSEAENEIASFLVRCGYFSGDGVEVDFNNLSRDMREYKAAEADRAKYAALLEETRARAEDARARVAAFLTKYGCAGENAQTDLTRLGALTAEYASLSAEKLEVERRTAASVAEAEDCGRAVLDTLKKYSLPENADAGAVADDAAEAGRLCAEADRLEKRAADYKKENALQTRPAQAAESAAELDGLIAGKRDALSLLDREINDDETSVERLDELENELEAAQNEEEGYRKKYGLISSALAILERAEQSLMDRYVAPVRDSFLYYGGLLERTLGERVSFDKDFSVRFERNGEDRPDAHLSAGQKSLCTLCLRLALIDNMYRGEQPFIIMDDPFVHLDGEHIVRAQALVSELAAKKQIIYFCCHESRQIKR